MTLKLIAYWPWGRWGVRGAHSLSEMTNTLICIISRRGLDHLSRCGIYSSVLFVLIKNGCSGNMFAKEDGHKL